MARPRSEDKQHAILGAAIQVIAELGVAAPTARIAKLAGVAEGSLFTYFATKDVLLNQLYLALKGELREVMLADYPAGASLRDRAWHVWRAYVDWGVAWPEKRKTMAQLNVSERVTAQTKTEGTLAFADVLAMIRDSMATGALRAQPPAFVSAMMGALADTTMDFMINEPQSANAYRQGGFDGFWHAISTP